MDKFFSSIISFFYRLILPIIISGMFIVIPQKNGWSMELMEEEERKEKPQKQSGSTSDLQKPPPKSTKQTDTDSPSHAREKVFSPSWKYRNDEPSLKEEENVQSQSAVDIENVKRPIKLSIESKESEIGEDKNLKVTTFSVPASWGVTDEEVEAAFSQSPHLVCILELGGYFKRLNPHWMTTLGWSEEELLANPYHAIIHPDDLEKTLEYEKFLIPTGFVNRFTSKNGTHHWFNWMRFSAGTKAKGRLSFCILTDITIDYFMREENDKKICILNDHLQIQSGIIKAVTDLQKLYLGELGHYGDESNTTLSFQRIIQHFVKLSQSQFGFIGSILNDEGKLSIQFKTWEGNPHLSERNQKLFEECKQEIGGFSYLNQLLNKVISTEKPLIIDEKQYSSEATGSSENALVFDSFLGIPLLAKDELVGIIALVNRSNGYNQQLLEWFEPLFILGARIVNEANLAHFRKRAKSERQGREKAEAKDEAKSICHWSCNIPPLWSLKIPPP